MGLTPGKTRSFAFAPVAAGTLVLTVSVTACQSAGRLGEYDFVDQLG